MINTLSKCNLANNKKNPKENKRKIYQHIINPIFYLTIIRNL
jgi:hypothetical protein